MHKGLLRVNVASYVTCGLDHTMELKLWRLVGRCRTVISCAYYVLALTICFFQLITKGTPLALKLSLPFVNSPAVIPSQMH